jgi:hypothetical protein
MNCFAAMLVLVLGPHAADFSQQPQNTRDTPAEQFNSLLKQFNEAARVSYLEGKTDEERKNGIDRIVELSPSFFELAERYPNDPVAIDALVQTVNLELYLMHNTFYPGRGKDNLESKAIAILLRDHVASDRLGEASRRISYGFSRDCETFLRTVLDSSPHRDVRALACLRLAQFLNGRLRRLDLIEEQPEMARRFEGLYTKEYIDALRRQARGDAIDEVESVFERAVNEYGDVKVPYGETVAAKAKSELHELRHLSIGKVAPDIDGEDQDGKRFKLSDYRGKVVLLYFWSEY